MRRRDRRGVGGKRLIGVLVPAVAILLYGGCAHLTGTDNGSPDEARAVYVAFGDSLTAGTPGTNFPAMLRTMIGGTVVNEGRPGETSAQGRFRVDDMLAGLRPDGVIIFFGANDVIQGVEPLATMRNLEYMIDRVRAAHATPVLATLSSMYAGHAGFQPRVVRFNAGIRDVARRKRVALVELEGVVTAAGMQADGLHYNEIGTGQVAHGMAAALRDLNRIQDRSGGSGGPP